MLVWSLSFFVFMLGLKVIGPEVLVIRSLWGISHQRRTLQQVSSIFREIEETLMAGLVPDSQRWVLLQELPSPWGVLSWESLRELRACGGSLLPTLKRLRGLSESEDLALADAQARSSQAYAQVLACSVLVPVLGFALYLLLPSIERNLKLWMTACLTAMVLNGMGCIWLFHLAASARWGGLQAPHRSWILISQCAGERFLALVRSGSPPDLAWTKTCEWVSPTSKELILAWGFSLWQSPPENFWGRPEQVIVKLGSAIRKAVQVSLMEGRPCTERVETLLYGFQQEMKALIEKELTLLGTRALKPLFVCIAPALLGLLFFGIALASTEILEGNWNAF
jgi:hypothetical protein